MEHEFSKQEIFALYLNVVFFGERAYGVAAAAETFYGKSLDQLTVPQAATLAGIVQAPSRYNPIVNPQFAKARRTYVLRRMKDLGLHRCGDRRRRQCRTGGGAPHAPLYDVDAQYVAEMARQEVRKRFGPKAETAGYRVYTTIDVAAADRGESRGAARTDRVRPPLRLSRAVEHVHWAPARSRHSSRECSMNIHRSGMLHAGGRRDGRGPVRAGLRQGRGLPVHQLGRPRVGAQAHAAERTHTPPKVAQRCARGR